jgi:hypothetical protein
MILVILKRMAFHSNVEGRMFLANKDSNPDQGGATGVGAQFAHCGDGLTGSSDVSAHNPSGDRNQGGAVGRFHAMAILACNGKDWLHLDEHHFRNGSALLPSVCEFRECRSSPKHAQLALDR